jgi:hypothetical protein
LFFSVITAVRFREHNRAIFLQIQTGQLMPLGMIDQSTLTWQNLPDNIGGNFFEFNYDTRLMTMTESHVENSVLTGE